MTDKILKSVITTDMEGRIETFNEGAENIFGYHPSEVIGKKRVSLFSPGEVVLEHVPTWLKVASQEGEYQTRTVFQRKDGTSFAAKILITPTFRDGQQIGFCGVTEELKDVDPAEAMPDISWATKMFSGLVVTRAPFLTATIMPILIGAAWVAFQGTTTAFPWGMFGLALLGGIALHIAANTYNDYFDWTSGTDSINNDYFLPYSGGSRSIELGLITEKKLFSVATVALIISGLTGLAIAAFQGPAILMFGLFGAFSAYFYTAPPLRLAARKGLGELLIGLNFGPLMTAGTVFTLTGKVTWQDFVIGLPIGMLITAILWINQFPDLEADKLAGKHNLVVVLGKKQARWGYLFLMVAAFGLTLSGVIAQTFPIGALLILGALPLAITATRVLFQRYQERTLVEANVATIKLHSIAGLLMAAGVLFSNGISSLLGL